MKVITVSILLTMMSALTANVSAQQLYKWVDDQGVTHYGEALPSNDIEHVTFEFANYNTFDNDQKPNPQDDYYSIQNQLKRLQDRRTQQLEEKKLAAEARAANNPPSQEAYLEYSQPAERYYAPAYYPRHYSNFYPKHHFGYQNGHKIRRHLNFPNQHKPAIKQSRSGISQKVKANRSKAVFSASR